MLWQPLVHLFVYRGDTYVFITTIKAAQISILCKVFGRLATKVLHVILNSETGVYNCWTGLVDSRCKHSPGLTKPNFNSSSKLIHTIMLYYTLLTLQ